MKQLTYFRTQLSKGFTLVELLIVVIILAILAAILVPQFASSTDDAKSSSLDTTLSNMRSAIDLYYQQHGKYPGAVVSTGGSCPAGSAADTTGSTANSAEAFMAQMTRYTNSAGQACTGSDATYKYGPYLKKDVLPVNPITNSSALVVSTTGTLPLTSTTAGAGWLYDVKTGQFVANDTNTDPSGLAYYKR